MKYEKVINGNFCQTHEMFGEDAGNQSAAITLFSICWTKVRRISLWKIFDLEYLLHKGDSVFMNFKVNRRLNISGLLEKIVIENIHFDVNILKRVVKESFSNSDIDAKASSFIENFPF